MSLSQALATAVSGLRTTQTALALVSSNVANAETPGYVRKTLEQATTAAGGSGVSVRVAAINRELDQFLQRQVRTETSGGAYADLRSQFYQRLQKIYGTPGADGTVETAFNNFTTALQALSTSPESYSARASVLSSAQALAQQLNGMTADVQSLRSDTEQGLADAVRSANEALAQIADINKQLATSHGADATSAALKDQRDVYIDQLSELMDIRVSTGDYDQVSIFTGSGIQLCGTSAVQLSFDAQGTMMANAQWNADPAKRTVGTITLKSASGSTMDLVANNAIRSGKIAAYLEMRDTVLVQAQNQLDQIAASMASALSDRTTAGTAATSGAQTGFDVDLNGLLAGNTINLTYADTATGAQHKYTIVRVDNAALLPLSDSVTADPNDRVIGIDFSGGLASVVNQLNSKFNGKVQFSNPSGTTLRILDDGASNNSDIVSASTKITTTTLAGGSSELPFFLDAAAPYTSAITSIGSQALGFAGRIAVNGSLLADPSKLVAYSASTPSGDATRPNFIYDQLTTTSLSFSPASGIGTSSVPYTGPLIDFMRQAISQQGDAAASAQSLSEGQKMVVDALRQRFDDQTGVNVDTEMAHLLTLQTAYGANARILAAVKDMLETLMQM